jgi:hypothetical protein
MSRTRLGTKLIEHGFNAFDSNEFQLALKVHDRCVHGSASNKPPVIGNKTGDRSISVCVGLSQRMALIANDTPPAHLLQWWTIAAWIRGFSTVVLVVRGQDLVRGYNNCTFCKNVGISISILSMVRIKKTWVSQFTFRLCDDSENSVRLCTLLKQIFTI